MNSLNETAHRLLMRLYFTNGNRTAALQSYRNCQTVLQRELGASPSPETEALAARIRTETALPAKSKVVARELSTDKLIEFRQATTDNPRRGNAKLFRILAVDDDEDIRVLLNLRLSQSGYEVTLASNGQEALAKLAAQHFDLLITDAIMDTMSGYALVRNVRTVPANYGLPIIMLTALKSEEDALQAFREGVDDFVTKPYSTSLLLAKVANLLKRTASQPQLVSPLINEKTKSVSPGSGLKALEDVLGKSWLNGSNILLTGEFGSGKSTFARHFLTEGIVNDECGMLITLDDNPELVREQLNLLCQDELTRYERQHKFRIVSADRPEGETNSFGSNNNQQLEDLAGAIMEAGSQLGQNTI